MTNVIFRTTGEIAPTATSGTITLSETTQIGDCILLVVVADNPLASVTFTPPSGETWITLDVQDWGADTNCCKVYYCKSVSSPSTTYTIGCTGAYNNCWSACVLVAYNQDKTTPIDPTEWSVNGSATISNLPATPITTNRDGSLLVWGFVADTDLANDYTVTPPVGYTNLVHSVASGTTQPCALVSKLQSTHGSSGAVSGSCSFGSYGGDGEARIYLIAIQVQIIANCAEVVTVPATESGTATMSFAPTITAMFALAPGLFP